MISFTSPNTWAILKSKSLTALKPGMLQLCNNVLGSLVQKGFFLTLRVCSMFISVWLLIVNSKFDSIFEFLQQILLKGTGKPTIILKPISFKAVLTLSVRPLVAGNFTENLMSMFLVHILSVPALIYQVESNVPDSMQLFLSNYILKYSLDLLEKEQNMKIVINSMKGTQSLALLANLTHLFHVEPIESATKLGFPVFTVSFQLFNIYIIVFRCFIFFPLFFY